MATVYLATDLRLERRVAIKVMHGHLADDNTFKTRFVQEARSAARLAHPNVVNVFDQGQDDDMAYLVMEHLPGINLRDLLKDYTKLTAEQTVDIMDAVLSGLAAAHQAGIVHRDLKPENVLLADDGRIKLGDFGLARAASANTSTGQALLGTIAYLSPELVTRGVADSRSDIYAVGILLYEMLTGEQPYVGEGPMQIAYQHANDSVPMPSVKNPAVPAELDELVLWATARNPDERPVDARAMLDRLREIEPAIRSSHNAIATHSTAVLPDGLGMTQETKVLGATTLVGAGISSTAPSTVGTDLERIGDETAALAKTAARRRSRGYWLFALVVLLAALAGGTGWYFGAGPGSVAMVPSTDGMAPDAAEAAIIDAGFATERVDQSDPVVPEGALSATDPEGGTEANRGSTVTIFVSTGPAILDVPDVIGVEEDDARAALSAFAVADDAAAQYSTDAPKGSVLAVYDSEGAPIGATYPERGSISLLVSAGAIPLVEGTPSTDAEAALSDAGLTVAYADAKFSDDVDTDIVMSAAYATDPMAPGDTVTLTVSKGPDVVEVPNVVTGQTIADARTQLEKQGFAVTTNVPEFLEAAVIAAVQTPAAGEVVKRGSEVSVNFQ